MSCETSGVKIEILVLSTEILGRCVQRVVVKGGLCFFMHGFLKVVRDQKMTNQICNSIA